MTSETDACPDHTCTFCGLKSSEMANTKDKFGGLQYLIWCKSCDKKIFTDHKVKSVKRRKNGAAIVF